LALMALAGAQEPRASAPAQRNPFDTPEGVQQGNALFQLHCAYCHGSRGEGGRGADLTTGNYRRGGADPQLYATIRNGIPGTEMPTVSATDDEVWKLVAFVKKIGTAGLAEKAPGDAVAGKAVYETKGRCMTCHSIARNGGSLGPDLADVGRRRNLKYLEESLVNPEADVPINYRALQVVTKKGQTVAGIRLNEDDSIQVRDANDDLRSFRRTTSLGFAAITSLDAVYRSPQQEGNGRPAGLPEFF
jgi:putative heme-binding domain-containing protein